MFNEYIDVTVYGFRAYVENEDRELYDFFIPTKERRLAKKDISHMINDTDTIIGIKKDNQIFQLSFDTIKKLGKNITK